MDPDSNRKTSGVLDAGRTDNIQIEAVLRLFVSDLVRAITVAMRRVLGGLVNTLPLRV